MRLASLLITAAERLGPLRSGRAIVFGSAPLALAGLPRQPRDLDLFVPRDLYDELLEDELPEHQDAEGHRFLQLADSIEIWASFPGISWEQVAGRARLDPRTCGLRVAELAGVRLYKAALGRPVDLEDIRLIDALLGPFPLEDDPTETEAVL